MLLSSRVVEKSNPIPLKKGTGKLRVLCDRVVNTTDNEKRAAVQQNICLHK